MTPSRPHILSPVDRLSRRTLLRMGVGGLGLSFTGLLQARAKAKSIALSGLSPLKACVVVFYYGGPSHLDTYDLKPDAPAEVRGEFKAIASSVPGLFVCEHLPGMARSMHKVALIRSMHHQNRLHDSASTEALTGRQPPTGDREEFAPIKQVFPCYGASLSYLRRELELDVPHAALPFVFHNVIDVPCQGGGFLGAAYDPLPIAVDADRQTYSAGALALPGSAAALQERRRLLSALQEQSLLGVQSSLLGKQWRLSSDKAFQLLGTQSFRDALDLSRETSQTRERYGYDAAPVAVGSGGGGGNGAEMGFARQMRGQNLLLARRLVEAGVPFVNVFDFRQQGQNWDAHHQNFAQHKSHLLPIADQSLSALIEDLDARGLLDTTLVVAMGEFGRTPQINKNGGRDHWPDCYTVLLAGGGVRGGAVFGASDRTGAYPARDPVTPADLAATIFWRFGIDPTSEIHDLTGRPWRLADGQPIRSLFV
ncbi:MAG: DUF1501 domain-containing protein [Planctomycetia bacterium]|nr:DUF1501 domain-containing protein [Planctomycetia bacterium]